MKNPHTPNLTWIGSWWPEIWLHEYLICPIEISVNWPGSQLFGTRQICTDFSGANQVFMRPYLEAQWTNSHQIWTVDIFAPQIHGIKNAEMQKKFFCDVIASVLYVPWSVIFKQCSSTLMRLFSPVCLLFCECVHVFVHCAHDYVQVAVHNASLQSCINMVILATMHSTVTLVVPWHHSKEI